MANSCCRSVTGVLSALLFLLSVSTVGAQTPPPGPPLRPLRLFLVPEIGIASDLEPVIQGERLSLDAWTLGAQVELVGRSRWTPLLAYHYWWLERTCEVIGRCVRSGWSAEGGVMHSFLPTSIVRPYGGAVLGVHRLEQWHAYLQGRAGIDVAPGRSPVIFRIEGRFMELLNRQPGFSNMFLLNTGIRFALPAP